jgi:hypothetical protein
MNPMDIISGGAQTLGAVFGGKARKMQDANAMANIAASADIRQSDFAMGGKMNSYQDGTQRPLRDIFAFDPNAMADIDPYSDIDVAGSKAEDFAAIQTPKDRPRRDNWLGQNLGNIAQYAPAVGNLLELKNLKRDPTPRGSRVEGTYTPGQFDEAALVNQINQQNIERSLTEAAGGDLGALRSSLIGAGAAKLKARGEGQRAQRAKNIEEAARKFQFGRQKDLFNVQMDERFQERAAKDKGAFETAKAALRKGVTESIGAIGREEVDKKTIKEMFGYKWDGKYWTDNKGNKYTNKEASAKVAEANAKKATVNADMFGGYTKR